MRAAVTGCLIALGILAGQGFPALATPIAAARKAATLSVTPTHGKANAALTATFNGMDGGACTLTGNVVFSWDGEPVGAPVAPDGDCVATAKITPPGNHRGAGNHEVKAVAMVGGESVATAAGYQIDLVVEPSKSPAAAPSLTPEVIAPSATPPASQSPKWTGPCDPDSTVPVAGVLLVPGMGEIAAGDLGPKSLLPPDVDFTGKPAARVTIRLDTPPVALEQALADREVFGCVRLDLTEGSGYRYVNYAFKDATVSSINLGAGRETATLELRYASAKWRYESTSDSVVVESGSEEPPRDDESSLWMIIVGVATLVLITGAISAIVVRRSQSA